MAADRIWPWANDPFEGPAENSDENAIRQIIFHDVACAALVERFPLDTEYPIWYGNIHPFRVSGESDFSIVYGVEGTSKSKTQIIDERLATWKGPRGRVRDWITRVSAEYLVSDPARIVAIFPHGSSDLTKVKKDNRIENLKTAYNQIGSDTNANMVIIKAEMVAEYGIVKPDRTSQQTSFSDKGITRTTLRETLDGGLTAQLGNLGLEIYKWRSDPSRVTKIKNMHYLEIIQQTEQKTFNPTLNIGETLDLAKRTVVFNTKFRGKATDGDAWAYLASVAGGIDSTPVKMLNGIPHNFTAADFAITDYGLHCHLTVVNKAGVRGELFAGDVINPN